MSRRRIIALVVLGGLMLAGCAPAVDTSWQPDGWPAVSAATITQQAVSAPAPVDAAVVPALRGMRVRNDQVAIQARVTLLPGTAPINERVETILRTAIAAQSARVGVAYSPAVFPREAVLGDRTCAPGSTLRPASEILADPQLGPAGGNGTAVVCDVVLAAGHYFGESIRVVSSSGDDVTSTFYTDVTSGEVVTADQLWNADAAPTLWESVVDALRRGHGSLSLAPIASPDQASLAMLATALTHAVPQGGGSVAVTIPPGFSAPELTALGIASTTESFAIAVPWTVAEGLLTPFGAALVAAQRGGVPFTAPAVLPASAEPVDCSLVPCMALTYDDGPSGYTSGILDEARDRHISLTFFAMGEKAAGSGELLRRAIAEGHLVENHTWNHPHLRQLTAEQITQQVQAAQAALTAATGVAPQLFRPPYGEYDDDVLAAAGLPAMLWNLDSFDWTGKSDAQLIDDVVTASRVGSVVLQHDIQPNTSRTAGAIYDGLADRGFVLVNLRQLFGGSLPTAGAWSGAH